MSNKILAEKIVKKALKSGADEAEVFLVSNRQFEVSVREGDVENIKQATSKGLGLTVFQDKRRGFSYTSDFSDLSIEDFIKKSIRLSQAADSNPWNGLPDFNTGQTQDLDIYDSSVSEISNEEKINMTKEVEKIAQNSDKRITKTAGGYFGDTERAVLVVNSKGIVRSMNSTNVYIRVGVVAGEGNNMQSSYWSSSKRYFKDLDSIENIAKIAVRRAVNMLGAKQVTTQKVPIVFNRYASLSFWYGILSSIYGDAVYKNTTFMTDCLEKSIASDIITIVDDPTIPRHVASMPFDGEGKLTRKNTLIDKGILKMFIYDSITARKAGVRVNTMARRNGYQTPPYADYLNIIVQNGTVSREKIIAGIKNGFYVTGLRGSGTDISTGNYSCGASGFWIKDGEITFPVDGVTLGGNALEILKNIELVANDLDLRENLNSPSFKVSEMIVGGKREG